MAIAISTEFPEDLILKIRKFIAEENFPNWKWNWEHDCIVRLGQIDESEIEYRYTIEDNLLRLFVFPSKITKEVYTDVFVMPKENYHFLIQQFLDFINKYFKHSIEEITATEEALSADELLNQTNYFDKYHRLHQ